MLSRTFLPIVLLLVLATTGCSILPHPRKFCTLWDEHKLEDASRALDKGDPSKAENLFLDVIRRSPHNAEARRRLIDLYLQEDRLDDAIDQMQLAIKFSPDDCQSYCNLAALLMDQKRPRDAQRIINVALRLEPANPQLLLMKGGLQEQDHNPADAQETYYRLLEVDPENVEAVYRLAVISLETENPQQALPLLRQVIQHPNASTDRRHEAEDLLATAYARTERWQQCATLLEQRYCEVKPNSEDFYRLAYAQFRNGNMTAASSTLEQLREQTPDFKIPEFLAAQLSPPEEPLVRTSGHSALQKTTGLIPLSESR